MGDNQRAFFRIDVVVPVVVRRLDAEAKPWDELRAETVDLSAGGLLIRAIEPIPAGHPIEVELRCENPPLEVRSAARVVRSWRVGKMLWLAASRFERLLPQHERDLVRFCFMKEREAANRANNVRVDIAIPIVLVDRAGASRRGSTVNVCADGAYVIAQCDAGADEEVTVTLDERWFGRELALRARVCRRDERGLDLEFCDLTRADRAALNQLVVSEERRRQAA